MANNQSDQDFLDSIGAVYTPAAPKAMKDKALAQQEANNEPSFGSKALGGLESFGKKALNAQKMFFQSQSNMGLGAGQGLYDTAKSVADIVPGMTKKNPDTGENKSILPDINLKQYTQGENGGLPFDVGYLGSQAIGDVGVFKALSKAGEAAKIGTQGWKYLTAQGAATGALTGENNPGGRETSAAIGAIGGPLSQLSSKGIADNIADAYTGLKSKYNGLYGDLFDEIKSRNIGDMKAPNIDLDAIKPIAGSSKGLISVKRYMQEPTFEKAQKAQSDLLKMYNKVGSNPVSGLTDAQQAALDARKKIHGSAILQLSKTGNTDLIPQYQAIQKGYATEMAPYLNDDIKDYAKGKVRPSKLLKSLNNDESFMTGASQNHPDFTQQYYIKKYGKTVAKNAWKGAALLLAGNQVKGYFGGNQ